ncbi:growth hormone secretagogue receptor type 1-like [Styela clava]
MNSSSYFGNFGNNVTQIGTVNNTRPQHGIFDPSIFSNVERGIFSAIIVILGIFGVVANVVTFIVIFTSPKLSKSPFNVLLMSLCVSDFLSACNSGMQLYHYMWGLQEFTNEFLCKATSGIRVLTEYVTIQHILVFSIVRLFVIQFPLKASSFKKNHARIIAVIIWIEVFFAAAIFRIIFPTVYPVRPDEKYSGCTSVGEHWRDTAILFQSFAVPIMLFLPMGGIVICTIGIITKLISVQKQRATLGQAVSRQDNKQRAALIQTILIVFSFLIGYSGGAAFRFTITTKALFKFTARTKRMFALTAYTVLRTSECLNPVFYNLSSSQLRDATKALLGKNSSKASLPNARHKATISSKIQPPT